MICIISISNNEPTGWIVADSIEEAAQHAEMALLPDLASEIRVFMPEAAPGKYKLNESRWLLVTAGLIGDIRWDLKAFGCR